MTSVDDLRSIIILSHLTEEMLAQLLPIIAVQVFEQEDVIFRQGEAAERFYMLRRGKVLLEQQIVDKVTVFVGAIEPGYSFGWSAMLAGGVYSADAVCAEPCEVLSFSRQKIDVLIEQTPALGLRLYRRLLVVLKKRFDYRTEQFRQAIMNHPDLKHLFSD
jgi:CRP-like cAMP-binding protein